MDIYLPKKRNLPYREIAPAFPGDHPTIVMDCGTLDGHQFEDLEQKVKEDAQERLKKQGGRYRAPIKLHITRLIDKVSRKITGYLLEYRRDE